MHRTLRRRHQSADGRGLHGLVQEGVDLGKALLGRHGVIDAGKGKAVQSGDEFSLDERIVANDDAGAEGLDDVHVAS